MATQMTESWAPEELRDIAEQVKEGKHPTATVRTLLSWCGAKRRGRWVVEFVRDILTELKLQTEPDFNWTYLDGQLVFLPAKEQSSGQVSGTTASSGEAISGVDSVLPSAVPQPDPTFRIGRLELANRPPVSVPPDAQIRTAVTIMLMNNFSQLPVIVADRHVKGLFSWRSLGSRLSQQHNCEFVREAMDECEVLDVDASLFDAVETLKSLDCVLIRDSDAKISGIMTAYDISVTFGQLGEPLSPSSNHSKAKRRPTICDCFISMFADFASH